MADAYNLWYDQREEVLRSYRDDLPNRLPLSQQKELRQIKNMVIQEAARMNSPRPPEPVQELDPAAADTAGSRTPYATTRRNIHQDVAAFLFKIGHQPRRRKI